MTQVLDPGTGQVLWRCPECGETIRLAGLMAVSLAQQAGRCHGCRARKVFERNPALVRLFVEFWARTGTWPQSDCWLKAVPASGVSIPRDAHSAGSRSAPAQRNVTSCGVR